jgi:hypothetical protein
MDLLSLLIFGLVWVQFANIWFGFSPPSSLRLPTHADYINAAAAQRLGELQANALANSENPFSIDGKMFSFLLGLINFFSFFTLLSLCRSLLKNLDLGIEQNHIFLAFNVIFLPRYKMINK